MKILKSIVFVVWCIVAGTSAAQQSATPTDTQQVAQGGMVLPDQEKARSIAETTYNTWRLSIQRGDANAWRGCTSLARQMKVRNMIVSQRGNFPQDFFRGSQNPPLLDNFRYVGALSGCGGRTMAATYIGRMKLGDAAVRENAFVLEFVYESGKWRLDQTRFFDLSRIPNVLQRLQKRDLSVLSDQDGFHPYRAIPVAPPACGRPELIGKVFVDCPGRAISMRINGISAHDFDDERRADTISGGLKRGANTITYTIRPSTNEQEHPSMGIGIFVMPETEGNKPVCVFDHILDAKDEASGGTFTFTVTQQHIASMHPQFRGPAPQPTHAVPLKPKPNKKDTPAPTH